MGQDVIKRVRFRNLRLLEDVTLDLDGLTVLIGENGSGKSTIVEGFELLRRVGEGTFDKDLIAIHGGASAVLRSGTTEMSLRVEVALDAMTACYELELIERNYALVIQAERLTLQSPDSSDGPRTLLDRSEREARYFDPEKSDMRSAGVDDRRAPLLPFIARGSDPAVDRVVAALKNIDVHLPLEVLSRWAANASGRKVLARNAAQLIPTDRLERFGNNLVNVLNTLRNERPRAHWDETLFMFRLGLRDHVEDVIVKTVGLGEIAFWLKYRGLDQPVPASQLSDGTLAFLGLVGMLRIGAATRSVLVLDEPELHLHPQLLARLTGYLDEYAGRYPIVVATHSSRLLDALQDPIKTTTLCELDSTAHRTRLRRFDEAAFARWRESYDGLGSLLAAGYERHVLAPEPHQ